MVHTQTHMVSSDWLFFNVSLHLWGTALNQSRILILKVVSIGNWFVCKIQYKLRICQAWEDVFIEYNTKCICQAWEGVIIQIQYKLYLSGMGRYNYTIQIQIQYK